MKASKAVPPTPREDVWRGQPVPPLPQDAQLLSLEDVGGYLRRSRPAVRRMLENQKDEVGALLRQWVVTMTDHRRYILRQPFMDWYRSLKPTVHQ